MSLFGKKPVNPNKEKIDSSKCNFLLPNGICGMTTYGIMRTCAKEDCIFMQMLNEKRLNKDHVPEDTIKQEDNLEEKEEPKEAKVAFSSAKNPCSKCGKEIEKNLPDKEEIPLCKECRKNALKNQFNTDDTIAPEEAIEQK